ncbi:MAG: LysR family transcriptional regulator [Rhizobiaceae bacterium]|nr:LysR family transcriptional regulator [Rhizobiaceae bacterium]
MPRSQDDAMPPLDWLRSFEAAARLSSFTRAASELGLTQAAVSQHIGSLEGRLRCKLFTRLPRGVQLTPQGAAYLPHIQAAFGIIGSTTAELFTPSVRQRVTIRSPISFAVLMLAPAIPEMSAALPHVQLDVVTIHVPADYEQQDNDLDIRFGGGAFAGRLARRLTLERLVPVAAPRLASRENWTSLPLLTVAGAREMWAEWFAAAGMPSPLGATRHRFDSFVAAQEASCHGAGALLGSRPLVDAALRDGRLARLSSFELRSDSGHYLTRPSGRRLSAVQEQSWTWLTGGLAIDP